MTYLSPFNLVSKFNHIELCLMLLWLVVHFTKVQHVG